MIDAVPYFFALGAAASLAKSGLRLPPALFETLSIYLLLAIGLKGGVELASSTSPEILRDASIAIGLGALIPLLVFPVFRLRLGRADSASLAAHYGSVSIVTFAVAVSLVEARGYSFESHLILIAALMEVPALLVATLLARLGSKQRSSWPTLLHEIFSNKSVVLLSGGLLIGWIAGPQGTDALSPLFVDLFKGALCLFLLEMGLIAADRLPELRRSGAFLIACGILLPPVLAMGGWMAAQWMGLSIGGTVLMMVLAGSASYIAAPSAMRLAIPEANPALGIAAALAVSFPFNLLVGIPLYIWIAGLLAG